MLLAKYLENYELHIIRCAKLLTEDMEDQTKTRCGWCAMKIGSFPLQ